MRWCTCLAFACLILPPVGTIRADEPAPKAPPTATSQPSANKQQVPTDLFLARSLGGSRYAPVEKVLFGGGSSPELVSLPKGGLLAVFDAKVWVERIHTSLVATRSNDQGRTWTRARPVKFDYASDFEGRNDKDLGGLNTARHAEILRLPNGSLRMYFTISPTSKDCEIRSATSVDGLRYKLDPIPAARLQECTDARAGIVRVGTRFHLFVTVTRKRTALQKNDASAPEVLHYTSRDGRKFESAGRVALCGGVPGTGFIRRGAGIRAVITLDGNVRGVESRRGKEWTLEPDPLMNNARNASVVEMRDGTYLMAFEREVEPRNRNANQNTMVALRPMRRANLNAPPWAPNDDGAKNSDEGGENEPDSGEELQNGEEWPAFAEPQALDEVTASPNDDSLAEDAVEGADPAPAVETPADADAGAAAAEMDEQARAEQERLEKERADWLAVPDPVRPPIDSLPPLPDFTTPVNYAEWYARLCDINTPDNAYWAYDEFMPGPLNPDRQKEWPTLEIMYNRTDFTEPAPWDPQELEEWEASYQASLPLLQQFETASRHTGFARPVQFRPEDSFESPTGQPLLVGLLLPDLSAHRALVKQTLSANWRMGEDGKPNPDRMIEGWRTSLSSANHMHQGATLIEQLVGTAEQNLVESDARYALKHGVFKGEQLEQALATLEQNDRDDFDAARSMQGEHAFVLDLMQAMFKAEKPGDLPRPAPEAIDKVVPLFGEDSKIIPEIKAMTPADVKKTLNAFETYYAEASNAMATGYPQVRTSDMDAMAKQHVDVSPMTRTLLPAFGRIQKIRARNEASRRATQLSYAVHIYKEQTGQWPQSLDDLPPRFSATMRTDPFTGGYFGYRVDASGPVIYSLSENGVDDGGQHSARWDDEKSGESDDHIFWPPQPK